MSGCSSGSFVIEAPSPKCHLIDATQAGIHAPGAADSRGLRRRRPRPSVELPIIRCGRAECGVSHVWHAPRACHGHRHERPAHRGIPSIVSTMILTFSIHVLHSSPIMLKRRNCSNACRASAKEIDHWQPILANELSTKLVPAAHRPAQRDARIVCGVEWAQARLDQYLVDPLCEGGAAVLLEARGVEHPITESGIARVLARRSPRPRPRRSS